MSFPRNNNSLYNTFTRSNSAISAGSNLDDNTIPQLFNEIHKLLRQVNSLQNSHNELINILAPMFPRDTHERTNVEAISDAVLSGK